MHLRQRLGIGGGAALLLLLLLVPAVFAHAELVGSDPADGGVLDRPPERIQLFFSEPIEPEFFALQVYAADRGRVDRGDARISPTDPRVLEASLREVGSGTYTVVWRAVSLDSHVVRGSFAFAVGAGVSPGQPLELALPAEGAPFPVESAARWLTFLTVFVLLGGLAFRPLILDPAMRRLELPDDQLGTIFTRRWLWLGWSAAGLLVVVSFAALLFQASSAAGIPLAEVFSGRAVTRVLTATRYGGMWLVRLLLVIALFGVLAGLSVSARGGARWLWWLGAGLSAGALLTISAAGHPSAVQNWTALAILADWAHMVAGGLWVGGLVQLGLGLPAVLGRVDPAARRGLLASLVPRFSWLAGSSVGVLILTGLYASLLYVPSWTAVLDTAYGAALSGKVLLVLPLVLLGAINLLVLHPRFRRAAERKRKVADDVAGRQVFRAIVLAEVGLAVVVLAATGILTGLPPASSLLLEAKPFSETQTTARTAVAFSVRPNQAGENRISVELTDARGGALSDVERVRLTLTMLDMEMGARELELQPVEPGRYEVEGKQLSMAGHWQAEVAVRRGGNEEQASFAFTVSQAPGANRPAFSPARVVVNALNARSFLAAVALFGAVFLLARRSSVRPRDRRWATAATAALLVVGLGVGGVSVADAYRRSLPNPVPADAASLARGQAIYQAQCLACHGEFGRGDGPAGRVLRPRPADFRVHMAAGHTDQELFEWVTNGVEGTAMPGFGGQLSEQERWDVINYIRTFADR